MKKTIFLFILIFCFLSKINASEVTIKSTILVNNQKEDKLMDKKEDTYRTLNENDTITIKGEEIYGLYIIYEKEASMGCVKNDTKSKPIGTQSFLHEYIDIQKTIGISNIVTLNYSKKVNLAEIYVLEKEEIPPFVEKWNPPLDKTDMLLFSTHSDDEHLFFAGLIPTYIDQGHTIQIVYMTCHEKEPKRFHEALHGLYKSGIRNYPIIGKFPDEKSYTLEEAIKKLEKRNRTLNQLLAFQTEMIRRFKPKVIVGHDELGEYGHGQHMLNTYSLKQVLDKTHDADFFPDSYKKYGGWEVPKTYFHSYTKNKIILNFDLPLNHFDGKTAFNVSKESFEEHKSQIGKRFYNWIYKDYQKATEIEKYTPTEWGLYKTTVGEDQLKNDLFENIDTKPEKEINKKFFLTPTKKIIFLLISIIILVRIKRILTLKKL